MKNSKRNRQKKGLSANEIKKNERFVGKCEQIVSDVLGSYTGTPVEGEQPVQDVDDL